MIRALWICAVGLAAIGVAAAIGRGAFRGDFATRADPVHQNLLEAFGLTDPFAAGRPGELARFDARYAANPTSTWLHVLPGALFLVLALLQFSPRVRNRHIRFHRWSGRILLLAGGAIVVTGLYFGLLMPIGGAMETAAISLFGGVFLFSLATAYLAIRRREVERHREWMIRAFAVAIGISTVRLVAALFDVVLTPAGFRPPEVFVLSLWTGWGLTLGAAEAWIRHTRPLPESKAVRPEMAAATGTHR
jgi:uncharacterized membrane protein